MAANPIGMFLISFIDLYIMVLIARILLSWLPAVNWYEQPWAGIQAVTDPAMRPFRGILPAFGGMDFSPILLFVVLNFVKHGVAAAFGIPSTFGLF